MSKDTSYYFSHDYNARTDYKIKKLVAKHGMTGYGVFWAIIEDLYNNANALRTDYEVIAYELRVDESMVKSIIIDSDLFVFDGDTFGSMSVQKRLETREKISKTNSDNARKRWEKHKKEQDEFDATALRTQSDGNAKGKESKERKERKEKELKNIIPPPIDEFKKYCLEKGVDDAVFYNHYEANGWVVGKTKMKNWQATVCNWAARDKKQTKPEQQQQIYKPC